MRPIPVHFPPSSLVSPAAALLLQASKCRFTFKEDLFCVYWSPQGKKKRFVLGGLGLLSLRLIYHTKRVRWGLCCCCKKTINSWCSQHPQSLFQGGNKSGTCKNPSTDTHVELKPILFLFLCVCVRIISGFINLYYKSQTL